MSCYEAPSINEFKKFLIDEVKRKSFAKHTEIAFEVDSFSKTNEFMDAYTKWRFTKKPKNATTNKPKKIFF